jgi:poly(3-hydroxybutyrate) depolymerase
MMKIVIASISFLWLTAVFPVRAAELFTFTVNTAAPANRQLEWAVRVPAKYSPDSRLMVLFGGRNWNGKKAIDSYHFDRLSDKYGVFLISPSFKDDDYWEPEKWSGQAMLDALQTVRLKFGLKNDAKLFYYGYSAGAQCANLFYHWKPEIVEAWGAHACGVWFKAGAKPVSTCPAVITCGENDEGRFLLSVGFVRDAREKGFPLIWRSYPGGHELNSEALRLAAGFFEDILAGYFTPAYIGDDQTMQYYIAGSGNAAGIEPEYRNVFYSRSAAEIWKN